MKIIARVKLRSKKEEVIHLKDGSYIIKVSELPVEGRANKGVVQLLSEFFKKPKNAISLLVGEKSKIKNCGY